MTQGVAAPVVTHFQAVTGGGRHGDYGTSLLQ